jgi:hypothetical protein
MLFVTVELHLPEAVDTFLTSALPTFAFPPSKEMPRFRIRSYAARWRSSEKPCR